VSRRCQHFRIRLLIIIIIVPLPRTHALNPRPKTPPPTALPCINRLRTPQRLQQFPPTNPTTTPSDRSGPNAKPKPGRQRVVVLEIRARLVETERSGFMRDTPATVARDVAGDKGERACRVGPASLCGTATARTAACV